MVSQVPLFVLTRLLSSLWVSRTGSASDFCALQEALYKCIGTIQYNSTLDYSSFLEGVPLIMWHNHFLCGLRIIPIRDVCRHFKKHFCNRRFTPHTQPHLGVPNHRSSHLVHVTFLTVTLMQPWPYLSFCLSLIWPLSFLPAILRQLDSGLPRIADQLHPLGRLIDTLPGRGSIGWPWAKRACT